MQQPSLEIEQLYGQISMFDLVTEEMIGWGEDDENQGDNKMQEDKHALNSDLQEIFDGEDECEGCGEGVNGNQEATVKLKNKPKWGKLQNLDLIPNTYIYHESVLDNEHQSDSSSKLADNIDLQKIEISQDTIFDQKYAEEAEEGVSSDEEHKDRILQM